MKNKNFKLKNAKWDNVPVRQFNCLSISSLNRDILGHLLGHYWDIFQTK